MAIHAVFTVGTVCCLSDQLELFHNVIFKKSETELTASVLRRKKIRNTQKVKQNAFRLDKTRQNANFQGNPLLQAVNITEANNLPAANCVLPAT